MLSSIKAFFDEKLAKPPSPDKQIASETQLACAALFIEVMKADHELDDREKSELVSLLQSSLHIQEEDIQELIASGARGSGSGNFTLRIHPSD